MRKSIALLLVTVMAVALLFFTGSRTVHLVQSTLPPDAHMLGYLALVALDGGIIFWSLMYMHGARGPWQRGIALLMVIVDLAGVAAAMAADTLISSAANGIISKVDEATRSAAIWAVIIVIILNVAGVVFTHLLNPENMKAQADEEARGRIEDAARRQILDNAETLAAQLAPVLGSYWVQETAAQYTAKINKLQGRAAPELPLPEMAQFRYVAPRQKQEAADGGKPKTRKEQDPDFFTFNSELLNVPLKIRRKK